MRQILLGGFGGLMIGCIVILVAIFVIVLPNPAISDSVIAQVIAIILPFVFATIGTYRGVKAAPPKERKGGIIALISLFLFFGVLIFIIIKNIVAILLGFLVFGLIIGFLLRNVILIISIGE